MVSHGKSSERQTVVLVNGVCYSPRKRVCLGFQIVRTRLDFVHKSERKSLSSRSVNTYDQGITIVVILTSNTRSTLRSSPATGAPITGTVLNNPALPIMMLRNTWLTRTNCKTVSRVGGMATGGAYFAVGVEDRVRIASFSDGRSGLHLRELGSRGRHDLFEGLDDMGKRPLADDDQWAIQQADALCWGLKLLRSLGEDLNGSDNLSSHGDSGKAERQKCRFASAERSLEVVIEGVFQDTRELRGRALLMCSGTLNQ